MGTTVPSNFTGRLEKFGEDTDGSTSEVVIIGPVSIASISAPSNQNRGNAHRIRDFAVAVSKSASNTRVYIQKSNDNTNWTKVAAIIIPDYGNYLKSYMGSKGIVIRQGQHWRVIAQQTTAARITCEILGDTAFDNVVDI